MPMFEFGSRVHRRVACCAFLILLPVLSGAHSRPHNDAERSPRQDPAGPGLGIPVTRQQLASIDITIMADGAGLPPGSGTAVQGAELYAAQCGACHGVPGNTGGARSPALTGGLGTLGSGRPVRTVNSFWRDAPALFDYVRRAMPPTAPQSLSNDDVYAIVAYLLSADKLITQDQVVDSKILAGVKMPNRNGFYPRGRSERSPTPRR